MLNRIGYPCVSTLINRTTNHTCRLSSATPEKLTGLIEQNLDDLEAILKHNLNHGWRLFRIGSSVIPFGSHPVNQLKWWRTYQTRLRNIGHLAAEQDIRLSFHPGQFTVLNSPDEEIIARSVEELNYSTRFLDAAGLDSSHKIVIHLGGVYGNKTAALDRLVKNIQSLDAAVRSRLVIENDERSYTPADALKVSELTGIPVVFDNLHYQSNPGNGNLPDLLPRIFATWKQADGLPKVHFSTQAEKGRTGNHADYADPAEYQQWVARWSDFGDFDLMLEAKAKDKALLALDQALTRI